MLITRCPVLLTVTALLGCAEPTRQPPLAVSPIDSRPAAAMPATVPALSPSSPPDAPDAPVMTALAPAASAAAPPAAAPPTNPHARFEEEVWRAKAALGSPQDWPGGPLAECWCAFDGAGPLLCPTANPASCTAQRGANGATCRGLASTGANRDGSTKPSGLAHDGKLVCGRGRLDYVPGGPPERRQSIEL